MESYDHKSWNEAVASLSKILSDFQEDKISMTLANSLMESVLRHLLNEVVITIISDIISEIDGFPGNYNKLLSYLENAPSRDQLIDYLKDLP